MSGGKNWSAADVRHLTELRAMGVPFPAIAVALTRTVDACWKKATELRITKPTPGRVRNRCDPEIVRRCVRMRKTHSASQIGEKLGITRNSVIGIWRRHAGGK